MKFILTTITLITIIYQVNNASGIKILGIFPSMSKSHFITGHRLMLELASLGHNVTVLSPFPISKPPKNYQDFEVDGITTAVFSQVKSLAEFGQMNRLSKYQYMYDVSFIISNHTLNHPKVKALLNDPNEHFDLVIQEAFLNEALHGIAHHFKAPIVGLSTLGSSPWTYYMVGTPWPISYCSSFFLPYTTKLSFLEKLDATIYSIAEYFLHNFYYFPMQEGIYQNYFPGPKPSLWELHKNISLVLLNQHFTLDHPRPYVPNMIEVGGIQMNRKPKPLPANIQKFLDSATDGAIYFSLGSNIPNSFIGPAKINAVFKTFSKLKQKVLWKTDVDYLENVPDNILIQDWFPQEDILAHPNTKLFITHGGLLSLMETLYHRIPIIGIPFFADQPMNMRRVEEEQIGLSIEVDELDEPTLTAAINEVIYNKKYIENVNILSDRFQDQPMTALQTAVYWIEYVARHKGAPFMRSPSQDMNFIQYHSLDMFAVLLIILFGVIYFIKMLFKFIFGSNAKTSTKKYKRN